MRRLLLVMLLVTAGFAAIAGLVQAQSGTPVAIELAASPAPDAPAVADGVLVLTVVERAETDVVIDNGDPGDSIGDLLAFGNPVFDATNTTRIGDDQGSCVRTVVGKAWECSWTLILADGSIAVQGPFYDTADSDMAITGGTGAYRGASGQMHLRAIDATSFEFRYEIDL